MSARLAVVLPRFAVIVVGCLLASAAVTFAAEGTGGSSAAPEAAPAPAAPVVLVVPDVRDQAYVFAKGTLEDEGFAWKVEGAVKGYAANVVASQSPAPGTRVTDTGAPVVTLQLSRNAKYGQKGEPENESSYPATALKLADHVAAPPQPAAPAPPKPAAKAAPKKKVAAKPRPVERPAAFAVPGAPAEPLDEMPLDERARRLAAWLERHPKPSNANANHWLYQHQWIVTGARFGWWHGAEALEILVQVDRRVEQLWGVGSKSRALAEQTLADVREKSSAAR
jgi:hypothetical protein